MRKGIVLRDYDPRAHSDAHAVETGRDTLVQQQFREEVNINTIVRRFGLTGELPGGREDGMFGDFTGIEDLSSAIERVDEVRRRFQGLDPLVRERFANDPLRMYRELASLTDEELVAATSVEAPKEEAVEPQK